MRTLIIGYGNQGKKRFAVAPSDVVAVVDPKLPGLPDGRLVANYSHETVKLDSYDAAIVCTPTDAKKIEIVRWLLERGKHVLVEKPLWPASAEQIHRVHAIAEEKQLVCMLGYNHRYEPAIGALRCKLMTGQLGKIYQLRMFYGNGTAALVKGSWRDAIPLGVIPEVGSHLFDLASLINAQYPGGLENEHINWEQYVADTHENAQLDHAFVMGASTRIPNILLEMSYLSWKNTFGINILAENGSIHIRGLTKWGSSSFIVRNRVRPAGKPDEYKQTWEHPDHTWQQEYDAFEGCVRDRLTYVNDTLEHEAYMAGVYADMLAQEDEYASRVRRGGISLRQDAKDGNGAAGLRDLRRDLGEAVSRLGIRDA